MPGHRGHWQQDHEGGEVEGEDSGGDLGLLHSQADRGGGGGGQVRVQGEPGDKKIFPLNSFKNR